MVHSNPPQPNVGYVTHRSANQKSRYRWLADGWIRTVEQFLVAHHYSGAITIQYSTVTKDD